MNEGPPSHPSPHSTPYGRVPRRRNEPSTGRRHDDKTRDTGPVPSGLFRRRAASLPVQRRRPGRPATVREEVRPDGRGRFTSERREKRVRKARHERANRRKPRERGEPDPHTVTRSRRPEGRVTVRGVRREVKPTGMTRDEESREVEPTPGRSHSVHPSRRRRERVERMNKERPFLSFFFLLCSVFSWMSLLIHSLPFLTLRVPLRDGMNECSERMKGRREERILSHFIITSLVPLLFFTLFPIKSAPCHSFSTRFAPSFME